LEDEYKQGRKNLDLDKKIDLLKDKNFRLYQNKPIDGDKDALYSKTINIDDVDVELSESVKNKS
jgi:hypothetical protein